MIKFPLPKLFKWLVNRFLFLVVLSFLLGLICFFLFFKNYTFPHFVFVFLLGFIFCSFIFIFLFIRFFLSLDRVFTRVQDINKGKTFLNTDRTLYLDEEPGEFYELNRTLNQINSYLVWQKRIISQESSELEAVISTLTEAILAIDQNKKVLFFNNQATLLFSSQRKKLQKRNLSQ